MTQLQASSITIEKENTNTNLQKVNTKCYWLTDSIFDYNKIEKQ